MALQGSWASLSKSMKLSTYCSLFQAKQPRALAGPECRSLPASGLSVKQVEVHNVNIVSAKVAINSRQRADLVWGVRWRAWSPR